MIKDPEEEVDLDAIDDTGYELVLPSGAKIGHRSLQRYYKQSLNPDKQLVLRKPSEKMLAHYRLVFFSYLVFQFLLYISCSLDPITNSETANSEFFLKEICKPCSKNWKNIAKIQVSFGFVDTCDPPTQVRIW